MDVLQRTKMCEPPFAQKRNEAAQSEHANPDQLVEKFNSCLYNSTRSFAVFESELQELLGSSNTQQNNFATKAGLTFSDHNPAGDAYLTTKYHVRTDVSGMTASCLNCWWADWCGDWRFSRN